MASWVQTPLQLTEQSSDEEKLSPHTSDSPVKRDSNPSFVTPLVTSTPSISLISSSDSSPAQPTKAPPSPVIIADGAAAIGQGSFYEITPELPQKKPLLQQQVESAKNMSGVMNRSKQAGHSFPPHLLPTIPTQGGAKLANLKDRLREAPPYEQVTVGGGGARTLWKAVFTGKGKAQNNRGETLPAEWLKKKTSNQSRVTVPGEESDLDSSTLLHRCSLKPPKNLQLELLDLMADIQKVTIKEEEEKEELRYVPHALAFRRSYATQRQAQKNRVQDSDGQSSCPTEVVGVLVQPKELSSLSVKETMFQRKNSDEGEGLETKITRRVLRAARRRAKQEQLKRLHKAQMIQRQLQQVEVRQRVLEEKGIMVEKALRGEAGLGKEENPALMQEWFQLVQQKSALARYESEVMIFARELELEDRQSRLQLELRQRMAVDDHLKEEEWLLEERLILEEMLEVVTQRDALVSLLEEQRLQEHHEDQDLEQVLIAGGLRLV